MKKLIELSINGERYELAVNSQVTLLEVLREHLGLTGTKEGCGTGECGSCTGTSGRKAHPLMSDLGRGMPGHGHYHHRRTFAGKRTHTCPGNILGKRSRSVRVLHSGHGDSL